MTLSILIPTLESRRLLFERIFMQLTDQIRINGLEREVEVLWLRDDKVMTVGAKRNELLRRACGDFVAFVDDDDSVAPDYVARICQTLHANPQVDCIGIKGIIRFRNSHPTEFIHSLQYREYSSRNGRYLRPPYHLNPIRRAIACRYDFAPISYSEDIDWALRLCRDGALRSEVFLEGPLYFYASRRYWPYQWMLDRTEWIRHALGLTMVSRVRIWDFLAMRGSAQGR